MTALLYPMRRRSFCLEKGHSGQCHFGAFRFSSPISGAFRIVSQTKHQWQLSPLQRMMDFGETIRQGRQTEEKTQQPIAP